MQSALWFTVVFGFWSLITLGGDSIEEGALTMELEYTGSTSSLAVYQLQAWARLLLSSVSLLGKWDHCEGEIK